MSGAGELGITIPSFEWLFSEIVPIHILSRRKALVKNFLCSSGDNHYHGNAVQVVGDRLVILRPERPESFSESRATALKNEFGDSAFGTQDACRVLGAVTRKDRNAIATWLSKYAARHGLNHVRVQRGRRK